MTAGTALTGPYHPEAGHVPAPAQVDALGPPCAATRHDGLVPGEEDLGIQRQCVNCLEPYPLDDEFFYRKPRGRTGFDTVCRACHGERNAAAHAARREAEGMKVAPEPGPARRQDIDPDLHGRERKRARDRANFHRMTEAEREYVRARRADWRARRRLDRAS